LLLLLLVCVCVCVCLCVCVFVCVCVCVFVFAVHRNRRKLHTPHLQQQSKQLGRLGGAIRHPKFSPTDGVLPCQQGRQPTRNSAASGPERAGAHQPHTPFKGVCPAPCTEHPCPHGKWVVLHEGERHTSACDSPLFPGQPIALDTPQGKLRASSYRVGRETGDDEGPRPMCWEQLVAHNKPGNPSEVPSKASDHVRSTGQPNRVQGACGM
jgi:hypothetical protein